MQESEELLNKCALMNATCEQDFVNTYGYDVYKDCKDYVALKELLSYEDFQQKKNASFVIYGCILTVICILGSIGNILSLCVMRTHEFRRSTTAIYLQVLMVVDTLFLAANFIHYSLIIGLGYGQWYITALPHYSHAYVQYNIIDLLRHASILLTVAVTVERYIFVCHSLHAAKICTPRKSALITSCTLIVAVIYEMPRFFMSKVVKSSQTLTANSSNNTTCQPLYESTGTDTFPILFEQVLTYIGTIAFFICPMMLLTALTTLLLLTLRRSSKFRRQMTRNSSIGNASTANTERSTTTILLSVVIAFIVCNLPNMGIVLAKEIAPTVLAIWALTFQGALCSNIAILFINVNSAINVLLFCFFGRKFRLIFTEMFIRCKWKRRERAAYQQVNLTQQTHIISSKNRSSTLQSGQSLDEASPKTSRSRTKSGTTIHSYQSVEQVEEERCTPPTTS